MEKTEFTVRRNSTAEIGNNENPEKSSEILAPVGGKESLVAAVRAGADAVYFGAKGFNARRNAENFESLGEAVLSEDGHAAAENLYGNKAVII